MKSTFGVLVLLMALFATLTSLHADDFDSMRLGWKNLITGGTDYRSNSTLVNDSDVKQRIASTTAAAQSYWNDMAASPTVTAGLFVKCPNLATDPAQITGSYGRLRIMALAYNTLGSTLYQNPYLLSATQTGLDWLYANCYHSGGPKYGNWWEWEIGTPMALADCTLLLYDQLSSQQVTNYMGAIDYYSPDPMISAGLVSTGTNLAWKAQIIAERAILGKSDSKMTSAMSALAKLFPYVTTGDGFYTDGSFVFHACFAYTGAYAGNELDSISTLALMTRSSSNPAYRISPANLLRVQEWIAKAFAPVLYKGAVMDMSRGRCISRPDKDLGGGTFIIGAVLRFASGLSGSDAQALQSMCKYWIQQNYAPSSLLGSLSISDLLTAKTILNNSAVAPMSTPIGSFVFPAMGRVTHYQANWTAALALSSNRNGNYELCNGENLKGWYTGDGMLYVYYTDDDQYNDYFWPTINPYRMPGTTVDTMTRADGSGAGYLGNGAWAGGTTLDGQTCAAGMELKAWNSSLTARKSWFLFDQEIIALGSNISCTSSRPIETGIDNRLLSASATNSLIINGATQPTNLGWTWSGSLAANSWIHLQGRTPQSSIGYYFPGTTSLSALREARSGTYQAINSSGSTNSYTRNYLTLWQNHGINPASGTYAYALLPGMTVSAVQAYASAPRFQILTNSATVQAIKHTAMNIVAANVWTNTLTTISGSISADRPASLLVKDDNTLKVAVSDPTWQNTGSINITVNKLGTAALSSDAEVTVSQLSPNIQLSVNVNGAKGKTFKASIDSWDYASIGTAITGNGATYANGNFTLADSGTDIWGQSDQFYYVFKRLSGNGEMVLRIKSQTNTNAWAKAGIMIRESTSPGSKHVIVCNTATCGVRSQYREATNGTSTSQAQTITGIAQPWIKLTRNGHTFTAYVSSNGVNWTQLASPVTVAMNQDVLIGMACCSHDVTKLNTTIIDNVSLY